MTTYNVDLEVVTNLCKQYNVLFQVYSRMNINTFEYDYLLTNHYIKFLNAVSVLGEQVYETIKFTSNGNWRTCSKMLKKLSQNDRVSDAKKAEWSKLSVTMKKICDMPN